MRVIHIMGNIGVGKSTLLEELKRISEIWYSEIADCENGLPKLRMAVMAEDVRSWEYYLNKMYRSIYDGVKSDYPYRFQLKVINHFYNIAEFIHKARETNTYDCIFVERSILEARHVFIESNVANYSQRQLEVLRGSADELIGFNDWDESMYIFLQAPIELCMQRIKERARDGENCIDENYMEQLVEQYSLLLSSLDPNKVIYLNVSGKSPTQIATDILKQITQMDQFPNPNDEPALECSVRMQA
jgi:deoxyadenosine/deoxycytidine kinase